MSSAPVDDLQFFAVVARSATLTEVARELGKSLPAISKRLQSVESRLGVTLVQRSSRRLALTSEGELYASRAQDILRSIADLEEAVGADRTVLSGRLVVQATLGLGRAHIGPLIARFARRHPQLSIQLNTSPLPLAREHQDFDVAIHVGRPGDSAMRITRLMANRRVVCAAPSYLAARGAPRDTADLQRHNCILLRENEGDYALWRFGTTDREERVKVDGTLASNDGDVVTNWAIQGLGLVMRSQWHVRQHLREGTLVEVMPDVPTPPADIFAVHADASFTPRRVTALIDYLNQELPRRVGV